MRYALLCCFFGPALVVAQDPISSGFAHFYNLEYDEAMAEFESAIAENPRAAERHNYLAQTILFREMYKVGALESELVTGGNSFLRRAKMNPAPEVEKRFLCQIQETMDLCQASLEKDPRDISALYNLGIAYGLRANYNYLVRKAWHDALRDATAGRKLHNKVTAIDRSNVDARLVQGLHDYIVGSLPRFYRMLGFLVGFRGDREQGMRTIEEVARAGNLNQVDAQIFLCALYRREGKPQKALPLLEQLLRRFPRNYLLRFEQAQMHSALGNKERALAEVDKVAELKRSGAHGYVRIPWGKIYFQAGTIQFWHNDLERSLENMQRVTQEAEELDLNTGLMAWIRIGQIYDLTNRRELAVKAYKKAIAFAPQSGAAREPQRYLSAPYRRTL